MICYIFCIFAISPTKLVVLSSVILSSLKYSCNSVGPIVPLSAHLICSNWGLQSVVIPVVWIPSGIYTLFLLAIVASHLLSTCYRDEGGVALVALVVALGRVFQMHYSCCVVWLTLVGLDVVS